MAPDVTAREVRRFGSLFIRNSYPRSRCLQANAEPVAEDARVRGGVSGSAPGSHVPSQRTVAAGFECRRVGTVQGDGGPRHPGIGPRAGGRLYPVAGNGARATP